MKGNWFEHEFRVMQKIKQQNQYRASGEKGVFKISEEKQIQARKQGTLELLFNLPRTVVQHAILRLPTLEEGLG